MKSWIKKVLAYEPLSKTAEVRSAIEAIRAAGLPYCPANEGDLVYSLIRANGFSKCLETGFHTGSTALYMAAAVADRDGHVRSICVDGDESVARGLKLLNDEGHGDQHTLIRQNSNTALPEMFLAGERFDFIFMDGWKTFDHLAFEMYLFNQMLEKGGVIAFDDSDMPSVRQAIELLKKYYAYVEVDYSAHNQTFSLRLFHILSGKSFHRPYRAVQKTLDTQDQTPFKDWHFFRSL